MRQASIKTRPTAPFQLDLSTWKLDQDLMHSSESLTLKPNPVWVIKQSRDGRFFATGAHDGSIKSIIIHN